MTMSDEMTTQRTFTIRRRGGSAIALDLEHDLNAQQRAAVTAGHGPKLVIAGAGTGKTRTITYRVAHLISRGTHPSRILLATFTNKAAQEMLRRVEALTGSSVGQLWGGTFHALGNRTLRRHAALVGYQSNYSILDEEDSRDLMKVAIGEVHEKIEAERFPSPAVVQEILSLAFNMQRSLAQMLEESYPHFLRWAEELRAIEERYHVKKRRANSMDYDDLLALWRRLLQEQPTVLATYGELFRHLLVDEYQDTNRIQAQIVELLASQNGRNLMVVGDDAQSIYGWRGAEYENIVRFPERNPGTEIFKLEINYRSTPQILHFTNASIRCNRSQYEKTLQSVKARGARPIVVATSDAVQEAAFVCERILQLRDEGTPLASMAVLYRAHAHSAVLQAELIKRDIPYDIRSGVRFFEQAHIKDVVAHLKILVNPFDEAAWRRLLLMIPRIGNVAAARLWGHLVTAKDPLAEAIRKDEQATLVPPPAAATASRRPRPYGRGSPAANAAGGGMVPKNAASGWKRFQEGLRRLHAVAHEASPAQIVETVLDTGYREWLRAKYENAQGRLEDIESLALFAKPYKTLERFLAELVLLGELYGQQVAADTSTERERLVLSSVHQAKGLEWEVVFLIRVAEGSFPSAMALRDPAGEAEERRVFYVAATRAAEELYITHPLIAGGYDGDSMILQPSRFLQEIDADLYEQADVEETDE